MRFIVGGRGGGKTYACVQWLKQNKEHILIVASQDQKIYLLDQYEDWFLDRGRDLGSQVWAAYEITSGRSRGRLRSPLYSVDNIDMVLPQFLGGSVDIVTGTGGVRVSTYRDNPYLPEDIKRKIAEIEARQ